MYCVRNILYYICIVILFISCSIEEEELVKRAPSPDAPSSQLAITSSRNASGTYTEAFGIFVCQSGTIYKDFDNEQFKVSKIVPSEDVTKNIDTLYLESPSDRKILFPSSNDKLSFYGYYPYKEGINYDSNRHYTINNWATEGVDLLVASRGEGDSKSPKVNLAFGHKFCKIVFNITADSENTTMQNDDLIGIEVKASNMNVVTKCDVITGDITFDDDSPVNIAIPFQISENGNNGQRAECIVCPGYNPMDVNAKRIVTFRLPNYGDKEYYWEIPFSKVLESGKSYVWNLKLKGNSNVEAELVGEFNDWEDGGEFEFTIGSNGLIENP